MDKSDFLGDKFMYVILADVKFGANLIGIHDLPVLHFMPSYDERFLSMKTPLDLDKIFTD